MKTRTPKPVKPLIKDIKAALKMVASVLDFQLPETKTGLLTQYAQGWIDGFTSVEGNSATKLDCHSLLIQVCGRYGLDSTGLALYQRHVREPLKMQEQIDIAVDAYRGLMSVDNEPAQSLSEDTESVEPIVTEVSTRSKAPNKSTPEITSDWFETLYHEVYKEVISEPFLTDDEDKERMGIVRKAVYLYVKIDKRYKEVANHPMNDDESDAGIAWTNFNGTEIDFLCKWRKTRTDNPTIKEFDRNHGGEWHDDQYRAMMQPLVRTLLKM